MGSVWKLLIRLGLLAILRDTFVQRVRKLQKTQGLDRNVGLQRSRSEAEADAGSHERNMETWEARNFTVIVPYLLLFVKRQNKGLRVRSLAARTGAGNRSDIPRTLPARCCRGRGRESPHACAEKDVRTDAEYQGMSRLTHLCWPTQAAKKRKG